MLKSKYFAVAFLVSSMFVLTGCPEQNDVKVGMQKQKAVMDRAVAAVPAYVPQKFAGREDINWSLKETEGRHIWYIYALAMDGKPLFYVVSDMKPRNKCISITPPDRVYRSNNGNIKLSSPALTGTYFGGANCNTFYMRDAQTGSYIELSGSTFTIIASKAPLPLETDQLKPKVNAKK